MKSMKEHQQRQIAINNPQKMQPSYQFNHVAQFTNVKVPKNNCGVVDTKSVHNGIVYPKTP